MSTDNDNKEYKQYIKISRLESILHAINVKIVTINNPFITITIIAAHLVFLYKANTKAIMYEYIINNPKYYCYSYY